jgi:3-phenylpropionate/trans-cinnamate dioxygenase ferredoxin reductase component
VYEDGFYAERDIELETGATVATIDPGASRVTLGDGRELSFDRLLLATGAQPRRIPVAAGELDGVYYLPRSPTATSCASDSMLAAGLRSSGRAGSAANSPLPSASAGSRSLSSIRSRCPTSGSSARRSAAFTAMCMRSTASSWRSVRAFEGDGSVARVRTSAGRAIECDFVVVGIGVAPRVELAGQAGLEVDNGVVVDEKLQTSAPNVFAAGDVARAWHPF